MARLFACTIGAPLTESEAPMSKRAAICVVITSALFISTVSAKPVCTAVADAATGRILTQEGRCDQQVTPASTFKIAISLMGYDSGFLIDEHSPALPFRQGYPDWIPSWRTTTDPTSWIKNSVARLVQDDKREPTLAGLRARADFLEEAPLIFNTASKQ